MRAMAPLFVVAALGCSARPPDPLLQPGEPSPELKACLERPEVQAYVERARARIWEAWTPPPKVGDESLVILFRLDRRGELVGAVVPDALTQAIEDSALATIHRAAPFPPLDEQTSCLADARLRTAFEVSR